MSSSVSPPEKMEVPVVSNPHKMNHQPPPPPPELPSSGRKKGGLRTMPFIIANESFEKVASTGLGPNMIFYLIKDYRISVAAGTNILFYWSAANNFMPVLGAVISDSYIGRFLTIGIGCLFSLLGMILLWLTSMIPQARPLPCNIQTSSTCKPATTGQFAFLISSFAVMSIGAGGIRPCSLAFGADQLDKRDGNPKSERVLETYFSWYYASSAVAVLIAFLVIVYIQEHMGWKVGFGIPVVIMFLSTLFFFIASPLYVKAKVNKNLLFASFAQVVVAAIKNRKLPLPSQDSEGYFHHKESEFTIPSEKLRFLNHACIIKNAKDISPEGVAVDSWSLCTVEQVEQLKRLVRVLPIWSASIMLSINLSQGSFPSLQARSMDRHLTPSFEIPSASFVFFIIITAMTWIVFYDRILIPVVSKIRGKPFHLGVRLRMGIGLFISCGAMAAAAMVEHLRRRRAIEQGFINDPHAVIKMSAMWLVPQHCLIGLAEAFNAIGQSEFYYSELPKSMSSIAAALYGLQGAVANLLASVVLNSVDSLTKGEGKESWISSNINKGHYENYYWLLTVMSLVNVFYYVFCCWIYGPCVDELPKVKEIAVEEEEELQMLGRSVATKEEGERNQNVEQLPNHKD